MMLLIGLAITVAFIPSCQPRCWTTIDFWWEPALLIVIKALPRPLDRDALAGPDQFGARLAGGVAARRGRAGRGRRIVTVAPSDLSVATSSSCGPVAACSADGEITDGAPDMNESMVTGRIPAGAPGCRRPRRRAGTVATDSGLRVTVTAVGDDTALAGIQRLVTDAQNSSSRRSGWPDKAAGWLFWFALGAAVITAVVWGGSAGRRGGHSTITVLVIACPRARSGDTPVVSIATERVASRRRCRSTGSRWRDATVGAVLFDKTGTLTKGEPSDGDRRRGKARRARASSHWRPPPSRTPSTRWPGRSSRRRAGAT
jgi:Cu2+-exporting ATPase